MAEALIAVGEALSGLPLLTGPERLAVLTAAYGDELAPNGSGTSFDGLIQFLARSPLDLDREAARGLATIDMLPRRLAALAADAEVMPRVNARAASVQPAFQGAARGGGIRSPSPPPRQAAGRMAGYGARLAAAAGLIAGEVAAQPARVGSPRALRVAPAGDDEEVGAEANAALLIPVGWLAGSLTHLAAGAVRAADLSILKSSELINSIKLEIAFT
jgi:hypothetical protein